MIKINILTHFLFALNTIGCINNVDGNHKLSFNGVKDSLQIPTGMSKNATLLNLGSDVEPILAWADYIGMLHKEGISYSHIHGVRYCYVYDRECDTIFYENIELRKGIRKFDFANCKIPIQITGQGDIIIKNGSDSVNLFSVLEKEELKSSFEENEYIKLSTIKYEQNQGYSYGDYIRVYIEKTNNVNYQVTFIDKDLKQIEYKLHGNLNDGKLIFSFLNREDGIIYFIDKNVYLYPVKKDEILKLK